GTHGGHQHRRGGAREGPDGGRTPPEHGRRRGDGSVSVVESLVVGARDAACRAPVLATAAYAHLRPYSGRWPRNASRRRTAGDLRAQPPIVYGRSGAAGGAARQVALSSGAGNAPRVLRGPLPSEAVRVVRMVHQQSELLAFGAVL